MTAKDVPDLSPFGKLKLSSRYNLIITIVFIYQMSESSNE